MRLPALALLVATTAASLAAQSPRVRTANGIVQGLALASGVHAFRGLPFAAPPVGTRRWQPPQPPASWTGVRQAVHFADQCMQGRPFGDMLFRNSGTSEDCLYLNVWAPAGAKNAPVLVYFYGGGFVAGDGSEPRYDGESMAQRGIVVVTTSYRLGIFGFFSHPALSAESPHGASGNYGLLDQTAALQWVRRNIGAFGGDPARVTIAGESAGSFSVSAQMVSPLAKGLIAGAIGESGAFFGRTLGASDRRTTEQSGVRFATALLGASGASPAATLAQLRALSAFEVLDASNRPGMERFGPNVDGWFFPEAPAALYARGAQARVPLLAGWNTEESGWRAVLQGATRTPTREAFTAALDRLFGARAADAARAYPAATDADVVQAATDLAGDQFIAYGTWRWLEEHARTSGQPVYRYLFARPRPAQVVAPGQMAPPRSTGAVHSAEIEYAMGNLPRNAVFAWTDEDRAVSATMQGYFERFIKTGNPNGPGLPEWPVGTPRDGVAMRQVIDVRTRAEPEPRARYTFLSEVWR